MSPPIPQNLQPLLDQFTAEIREKIVAWWSSPRAIISFRVNYLQSSDDEIVQALVEAWLPYQKYSFQNSSNPPYPLYQGGMFQLPKEHEYALRWLEIYTSGKIYVQSLTSMIPPLCMDLQPGQKILDMTAAPGSKTTQIASMLWWDCEITALEKFGIRYEKLLHTIKSQGAWECVKVVKLDAIDCAKSIKNDTSITRIFDRILIDAPCSSDGRIQLSDERTYRWYSEEKSKSKSLLQYEMLEQARKLLAPSGRIVYSTCSVSRRENEEVIQKFLKTHPDFHLLPCPIKPDYTLEEHMNRWFPSAMMEGFFVGILERKINLK